MSESSWITVFVEVLVKGAMVLMIKHGWLVTILALLGLFATISAIGEKVFRSFQYLFLFFIALPLIIIVGLINKKEREKRLKDLGDIKAHLKQNPEKWRRLLYLGLVYLFIILIGIGAWWSIDNLLVPHFQLNELTLNQSIWSNYTDISNYKK